MSARTPFFPQAGNAGGGERPPTRNTNRPSENSGSGTNPSENAPKLNTSGLGGLRKKNRGSLAGNTGGFNGTGNLDAQQIDALAIPRPATADPHARQAQGNIGTGTPLKPRLSEGPSMKVPHPPAFGTPNNGSGNGGSARMSNNPFGNKNAFARRESGSAPKIMAPVPIAPPTPILDGIGAFDATPAFSGFKTPAMPGQSANEAHIPSGNDEQHQAQARFRSSFTSGPSGDTSGSTNETYVEDADDNDEDRFGPNGNGKKDTSGILSGLDSGPRRVIIDSSGKAIGGTGAQYAERGQHEFVLPGHGINEHGRVFQQQCGGGGGPGVGQGAGAARQQLAGRKRNREQADKSMQGSPYGMPVPKRTNTGKGPGSARGQSAEQENIFPQGQNNQHGQGHGRSAYELGASQEPAGYDHAPASSELSMIMKLDVDELVRDRMEAYEQLVERWSSCSLEEWMAGSDELAAKYMAMLDLAKEKMTEQLRFYAGLETKLSNYGEVLEDRKQSLEIARQRVLEESRNVLK